MQNRVDPFGQIIETKERGLWMGNRGNIHNTNREIVRPFKLKAWITCRLQFKGRKREIMAPNFYTELFFLDEATAFAAGHRPCCECRREDYNKFKAAWLKENPEYKFTGKTSIREIDAILHKERIGENGLKKTYEENNNNLPNGTFVAIKNQPYLLWNKYLYLWMPSGYTKSKSLLRNDNSIILTPKSMVQAFRAGYVPQVKLI